MSSSNDESTDPSFQKRRKIQRACDSCKRKKKRCDGPQAPSNNCSNCITHNTKCTYEKEQKKRGRRVGFVEQLEGRLKLLEGLLKKLCPDPSDLHSLIYPHDPEYAEQLTNISTPTSSSSCSPSVVESASKIAMADLIHKVVSLSLDSQDESPKDDEIEHQCSTMLEQMESLTVDPKDIRFWGESSGVLLMRAAISMKDKHANDVSTKPSMSQNENPLSWKKLPWDEDNIRPTREYTFPSPDLIKKLTDAYFEHVNLFYPLLHRPTFELAVANCLHLRDEGFGNVLLLVCAVGSRYMGKVDERTLVDGGDPFTAGWKWYKQVQVVKPNLVNAPTLYDLQLYCLAVDFLIGCSGPQTVWLLAGFGIRVAMDVAAHRKCLPRNKLTVEDELWKRAFWILVTKDRIISLAIGRPCAIPDNHFDLELPFECDDEYWENPCPNQRFKQPAGVPSTVTAFNQHLRLTKIMAFSMNTIFSIKTKFWELISKEWEQHIVTALDSALNNWLNALPENLRWDPNKTDDRFFKLSGSLIMLYYYVQILIHRPYIRSNNQPSPLAFPSLAICNSAARSCALVLERQTERLNVIYPHMQLSCTTAIIVLTVNLWSSKRSGVMDQKLMSYVNMCMGVLKKAEGMSYCAGPVMSIFRHLTSVDKEPQGDSSMLRSSSRLERPSENSTAQTGDGSLPSFSQSQSSSYATGVHSAYAPPLGQHIHGFDPALQIINGSLEPQTMYSINEQPAFQSTYMPTAQLPDIFLDPFYSEISSSNFNQNYRSMQNIPSSSTDQGPVQYSYPSAEPIPQNGNFNYPTSSQNTTLYAASNSDPYHDVEPELSFDNIPSYFPAEYDQQASVDNNAMEMWFNAPNNFELNEWRTFFANFAELTNETRQNPSMP
ncbi:fungal-specific transcription factor domain-containing protein [Cyathus striatus]|nr:fungal-specific transcription factor domain-containing protein [Cyathus striatus]